jgi:myo-inositol 2-dehydrogenase/D-chiro-inositol 1-dehydrogenase
VLCEKPLAPTSRECLDVVAAEARLGKRLARVGFMRRYDPGYDAMKAEANSGALGRSLMFHCVHRNVSAPHFFTSEMAIANSAPHEFDIARFVLDSELTEISVFQPAAAARNDSVKPVFMVIRSASGALVNVEINNAGYGYHVKRELLGEKGTVALRAPAPIEVNLALANATAHPEDWRPRFAEAYRLQNRAWARAIERDAPDARAASAWDGYDATLVAEAGLRSLAEGGSVAITMVARPELYRR